MKSKFENSKIEIEFVEEKVNDMSNKSFIFNVDIKDFDTPKLNVEYEIKEGLINRAWIDEKGEINLPKSHVVYKIFTLVEYEVSEIIKFMIKHL